MYGLVNQAIRDMVLEKLGPETWERIRLQANADDVFVAMEQYPDDVTIQLVVAACKVLSVEQSDVLKMFGDYWVGFTAKTYGPLFDMSGNNLVSFVQNLNNLHSRVGQIMPNLNPPSFTVTDVGPDSFKLHYFSSRSGLHPMLLGLLEGLGRYFRNEVEATHVRGVGDDSDHDEFFVKYRPMQ